MANPSTPLSRPPLDFTPVTSVSWAEWSPEAPDFIVLPTKVRGRRRLGINYEKKVHVHLAGEYNGDYMPSQWVRFRPDDDGKIRWCQTDGVIVDRVRNVLTIVEVKYSHTDLAWWQLFRLYLPVLERLFHGHGFTFRCVEVCRWFDPSVRCPARPVLRRNISDVEPGEFAVHIFNP